jgi:hypothetical protein
VRRITFPEIVVADSDLEEDSIISAEEETSDIKLFL